MRNTHRTDPGTFLPFLTNLVAPMTLNFSDEIEAQRRRKGSPPQGRADAPVYRPGGGSSSGDSGGPGKIGKQPSFGGGGTGFKLPWWMIIIVAIVALFCGGKGLLDQFLGGGTGTGSPTTESSFNNVPPTQVTGFTPPAGSQAGSWTVMLYQDADDQVLEQDLFTDFNEAERVGSTDQVHIVAQLDRFSGAFTGDSNWTSTRRYYLNQPDNDLNTINSQLVADLGEVNMSDPASLVDFTTWAVQTFPADHYVLILSDHGMGWPGGWVDPAPASRNSESAPIAQVVGNALYLDQLDDALAQIQQQTGIAKLDIIGMDACLMGQLEVLSALEPYARYAITSDETEPSLGWAYTAFLQALTQNPGMSAADLSKLIIQSYIKSDLRIVDEQARTQFLNQMGGGYATADQLAQVLGKDSTLAVVDLSKVPALMSSVNDLAYALQSVSNQSAIASVRSNALSFTSVFGKSVPPSFIDLGSFVQIINQNTSDATLQQLTGQVLANIQQTVIAEKHGSARNGATGVSVYYPNSSLYGSAAAGPRSYTVVADRFAQNSLWDDFLAYHYNNRSFEATTREPVIPSSSFPSRAPGAGQITVSALRLSSTSAAPGQPVTMRADISGTNIGNIYLFVGYYDQTSNSIFVADTDFLESPNTQQVDGVYYPQWGTDGAFTVKFDWDPVVFTISDGSVTAVALFTPQQYGATAADALYSVDGVYTFASSGEQLNARLNFRDGNLVSVYGITGQGDTGAPRQILMEVGDTFTVQEKWLNLDAQGNVQSTEYLQGQTTLTFNGQPFIWETTYAAAGNYILGFVVTDLDGNAQETYGQIVVN